MHFSPHYKQNIRLLLYLNVKVTLIMSRHLFSLVLVCLFFNLNAQITSINPPFPSADQSLSIIFDARLGSGGLMNYSGDVYAHTGVITNKSTSSTDWRYVKTNWGENTPETRLSRIDNNQYQFTITPNLREYYQVPADEEIQSIAFVFRSGQPIGGSYLEGKTAEQGDIFVEVFNDQSEFLFRIIQPGRTNMIVDQNDRFFFEGYTSKTADLRLYDNGELLAEKTNSRSLSDSIIALTEGNHNLLFEAIDTAGKVYRDSIRYIVPGPSPIAALPGEPKLGAHPIGNDSVRFILEAPGKNEVWLIGSFTNWLLDTENYQMNRTPSGKYFWVDVGPLAPDSFYTYQYLVDREIYIADPLSEIVLDPNQDQFIDHWPNLPDYPEYARGITSLLRHGGYDYTFQHTVEVPDNENLVVYELLIRDFLQDHSYSSLKDTLDYLEKVGVNAIELMPIQEFEGNISWGYNPSFHGAVDKYYGHPDSLKAFIDEAHKRDILVILDIVYNHAFSQSPLCQLYWNEELFRPSPDNPWLNEEPKHPYNVGYDFNHEYEGTQHYVKATLRRWLEDYHFDGFRFDLSKGLTQRQTNDVGAWGNYDAGRIELLKDYGDFIWQINPKAVLILEHFAENREERELAEYGFLLWNKMTDSYNEATMGFHSSNKSDFSGTYYGDKGWSVPHLISFMESHDEERLMYKNLQFGNGNADYNIRDLGIALDRIEAASVFFYSIPGPKMLWQFGELGYDFSINRCTNGTVDPACRLSEKPIRWDFIEQTDRRDLLKVTSDLIHLKTNYDFFKPGKNVAMDVNGAVKRMRIGTDVVVLGNFDIEDREINVDFLQDGMWYEFFSGDSINIQGSAFTDQFEAGEYRLYLKEKIERASDELLSVYHQLVDRQITIYPNPSKNTATLNLDGPLQQERKWVYVFTVNGDLIWDQKFRKGMREISIPTHLFETGMYSILVLGEEHRGWCKLIKVN